MKVFTWNSEGISAGLQVQADEKLGQIVFLGETGRGRRYEKVGLARHNPAEILNGRVVEAQPVKITLPAKDGKPEKHFFILEKPKIGTCNVLVRINSYGGYIRGAYGSWQTIAGQPETLVRAYGAFGDAGRIGNWDDGLVVVHPGDVIKIHPSRTWGHGDSALWINEAGELQTASWQDYEIMMAAYEAEAIIANAGGKPIVAGQMPCFSFSSGEITSGIKLEKGVAGMAVRLGESGRGRKLVEVTAIEETSTVLTAAAVVDLGKEIFGLIQFEESEPSAYLVRISTRAGYTRRGNGSWEIWKGNPSLITEGRGADGDAGGIGSWKDGLFILREGDVIYVSPSGDGPSYAVFVKDGKVQAETWISWKVEDAKRDPGFYVSKGTAPWGHVPTDWIGRIVTTKVMGERYMCGGRMIPAYEDRETGELISNNPVILNLGWDGQDRHDVTVNAALWVILTDKKVRRLEGEEAEKRHSLRSEVKNLHDRLMAATKQSFFKLTEINLRNSVEELTQSQDFDIMPTVGRYNSLTAWVEKAKRVLGELTVVQEGLENLEQRQNSGETKPEPVEPTSVENDEGVDLTGVDFSEFFGGCVVR